MVDTHFTIFYPTRKEELPTHVIESYAQFERYLRPLHRTGKIQKMTTDAIKLHRQTGIYPWYSFAHEAGIMHTFFEDGISHYDTSFMDRIVDMLIDKGEFLRNTTPDLINAYEQKTHELSVIQRQMKDFVIEKWKKNKGR